MYQPPLKVAVAVAKLDSLDVSDPERAHGQMDQIIFELLPPQVQEAIKRVIDRAPWWGAA